MNRPVVAALSNGKTYPPREGRYVIYLERERERERERESRERERERETERRVR